MLLRWGWALQEPEMIQLCQILGEYLQNRFSVPSQSFEPRWSKLAFHGLMVAEMLTEKGYQGYVFENLRSIDDIAKMAKIFFENRHVCRCVCHIVSYPLYLFISHQVLSYYIVYMRTPTYSRNMGEWNGDVTRPDLPAYCRISPKKAAPRNKRSKVHEVAARTRSTSEFWVTVATWNSTQPQVGWWSAVISLK